MIKIRGYSTISVFGLGVTGRSVLRAASAMPGLAVFASDDEAVSVDRAIHECADFDNITFCSIDEFPWHDMEALVLSPGVPINHPAPHRVVELARQHNCKIICDIELLWNAERSNSLFLGISGTDGKSTTAKLVYDMLIGAGIDAQLAGNIGFPALDCDPGKQVYVLELSSFQLDLLDEMAFDCAVLLNVTADHADRYVDHRSYVRSKMRILKRVSNSSPLIIGCDSPDSLNIAIHMRNKPCIMNVSAYGVLPRKLLGALCSNGVLYIKYKKHECRIKISERECLLGRHNEENISAASLAAICMGVDKHTIEKTIKHFVPLPHRMQNIGAMHNVTFINDSKATTPNAMRGAVHALCSKALFLLIGGREKYPDSLKGYLSTLKLVKAIYLIGESTDAIYTLLGDALDMLPTHKCYDLDSAVNKAYKDALVLESGAVVLLSPACSSYDQWKNFEERGHAFAQIVNNLVRI